jgi:hypothetical protein
VIFHPEGGSPRDEISRYALRQRLNPALSVPGCVPDFSFYPFLLRFPIRTLFSIARPASSQVVPKRSQVPNVGEQILNQLIVY